MITKIQSFLGNQIQMATEIVCDTHDTLRIWKLDEGSSKKTNLQHQSKREAKII
jgi:hypothetical protein